MKTANLFVLLAVTGAASSARFCREAAGAFQDLVIETFQSEKWLREAIRLFREGDPEAFSYLEVIFPTTPRLEEARDFLNALRRTQKITRHEAIEQSHSLNRLRSNKHPTVDEGLIAAKDKKLLLETLPNLRSQKGNEVYRLALGLASREAALTSKIEQPDAADEKRFHYYRILLPDDTDDKIRLKLKSKNKGRALKTDAEQLAAADETFLKELQTLLEKEGEDEIRAELEKHLESKTESFPEGAKRVLEYLGELLEKEGEDVIRLALVFFDGSWARFKGVPFDLGSAYGCNAPKKHPDISIAARFFCNAHCIGWRKFPLTTRPDQIKIFGTKRSSFIKRDEFLNSSSHYGLPTALTNSIFWKARDHTTDPEQMAQLVDGGCSFWQQFKATWEDLDDYGLAKSIILAKQLLAYEDPICDAVGDNDLLLDKLEALFELLENTVETLEKNENKEFKSDTNTTTLPDVLEDVKYFKFLCEDSCVKDICPWDLSSDFMQGVEVFVSVPAARRAGNHVKLVQYMLYILETIKEEELEFKLTTSLPTLGATGKQPFPKTLQNSPVANESQSKRCTTASVAIASVPVVFSLALIASAILLHSTKKSFWTRRSAAREKKNAQKK